MLDSDKQLYDRLVMEGSTGCHILSMQAAVRLLELIEENARLAEELHRYTANEEAREEFNERIMKMMVEDDL